MADRELLAGLPKVFTTQDYLLYWDRREKVCRIASGRFRGRVWPIDHYGFFDRKWSYVGVLDGKRLKRLNYNRKSFAELLKPGLRKVYRSTLRQARVWANLHRKYKKHTARA